MSDRPLESLLNVGRVPSWPESIADRVYHQLRRELLLGRFPYGERLIEEQLADRFECSRTPVREALHRLMADGHLVRHSVGGLTPQPPQASVMRELYDVRVVLEDLVVKLAATFGDRDRIEALRDRWVEMRGEFADGGSRIESPDFVHADEAFHEGIATAAGNQAAGRFLRDINERIRVLRVHDFTTSDRIGTTIDEHIELASAILDGKADEAAALMRVHIDRSAKVVEERVGAMLARMFDAEGTI